MNFDNDTNLPSWIAAAFTGLVAVFFKRAVKKRDDDQARIENRIKTLEQESVSHDTLAMETDELRSALQTTIREFNANFVNIREGQSRIMEKLIDMARDR